MGALERSQFPVDPSACAIDTTYTQQLARAVDNLAIMEHETGPSDDDEFEDDPPQVRPWRMLIGSVFGLVGTALAQLSWSVIRGPRPEPQGSAAAVGQWYASVIAWVMLFVGALVAVVATVVLVLALLEARSAGHLRGGDCAQ